MKEAYLETSLEKKHLLLQYSIVGRIHYTVSQLLYA